MASQSEKTCKDANANANAPAPAPAASVETHDTEVDVRTKATRHPRWSRQETIILIEAKKVVENGGTPVCRLAQSEPKWDLVSSLCRKQGVNRGPVQCRKRWSNLLSDFKKIKKWDSEIKEEGESFWVMRNDERREKKLPGFFDGEVYNVLEGGVCDAAAFPLTLIKVTSSKAENGDDGRVALAAMAASGQCEEDEEEEEEEAEAIVDSEKMGWSTEEETVETITSRKKVTDPLNVSKPPIHPMPSSGTPVLTTQEQPQQA